MTTRYSIVTESKNMKTGPIPTISRSSNTCPTTCPWYKAGCYGEHGKQALAWRKLNSGTDRSVERGAELWRALRERLSAGPNRARNPLGLVRVDVVGDAERLASGAVDVRHETRLFRALIALGFRPFKYSHHTDWQGIAKVNANLAGSGTINVSCETVEQVDRACAMGLPAVIVTRDYVAKGATTPGGVPIRNCPATLPDSEITCVRCGLCARSDRTTAIAFPAHGPGSARVRARLAEIRHGTTI